MRTLYGFSSNDTKMTIKKLIAIGALVFISISLIVVTACGARKATREGYETYLDHGFSFEYPSGCSIAELGMLQSQANYTSGMVQATRGDSELYQVNWIAMSQSLWEFAGDLPQTLEDGFKGMEQTDEGDHLAKGSLDTVTKAGHEVLYQYFVITSAEGDEMRGVQGVFYCDSSERFFQLMTAHTVISDEQDILDNFQDSLDSLVCH